VLRSEHRDIRIPILADKHRAAAAAVREGERNLQRMMNHMAIGQDQAIGSKNETRARSLLAGRFARRALCTSILTNDPLTRSTACVTARE